MNIDELQRRYFALFGTEPVAEKVIDEIEARLGIKLPFDLKQIAAFYRGGFLGGKSHHAISYFGPATNIVDETLRLRKVIGLPQRLIALAEPAASLVVLETKNDEKQETPVIWCDATDANNLEKLEVLNKPQVWPSYAAFFSYLLDEEEEERS
jgi:hypothetical protein